MEPFKLERYFAEYEFKVKYLLSPSDCESLAMGELLALADAETLSLWEDLRLGYTESAGHPLLRAEVADLYENIPAGQVVMAAPEEAIFIAMHTLLQPGDEVICTFPAYQSLYEIAHSLSCSVTYWKFELGTGGWELDLEQLRANLTPKTRLLILNFPHNPTGYLPSRETFLSVLDTARSQDAYVFSDEMYRLLEYDPSRQLPAACDVYEKAITLSGLSKAFALPGLRIGWLASQDRTLPERWLTFKDYTTICNSAPAEVLGIMALRAREFILERNRGIIRENLHLAQDFFADHQDQFRWIQPEAGSVAFPQWRGPGPVDDFCQGILERQGVMIVPGSIFDYPGDHFRIGLGRKNLGEALQRVGAEVGLGWPLVSH